jgi:hypothetical protein
MVGDEVVVEVAKRERTSRRDVRRFGPPQLIYSYERCSEDAVFGVKSFGAFVEYIGQKLAPRQCPTPVNQISEVNNIQ